MSSKMSVFMSLAKESKKARKKKRKCDGAGSADGDEPPGNFTGILKAQSVLKPQRQKKMHGNAKQHLQEVFCSKNKRNKSIENRSTTSLQQHSKEHLGNGKTFAKNDSPEPKKGDACWSQKASWKSLVGESGRVDFNLQSVLASDENLSAATMKQPNAVEECASIRIEDTSLPSLPISPEQSNKGADTAPVSQRWQVSKNFESQDKTVPDVQVSVRTKPARDCLNGSEECDRHELVPQNLLNNTVANVCPFMRSENYEQEWLAARRAVKEVFKRTRKDAVRSMKIFHTRSTA